MYHVHGCSIKEAVEDIKSKTACTLQFSRSCQKVGNRAKRIIARPSSNVKKQMNVSPQKKQVVDEIKEDELLKSEEAHYELNPLMKKALKAELRPLMEKIYGLKVLSQSTAADKVIVDTVKSNVGKEFRAITAVNVSERLLNVPKTFYVKVTTAKAPPEIWIKKFSEKFNIVNLKSFSSTQYAAKVRGYGDFDKLFSVNKKVLGGLRVSCTPLYQFKIPENMKNLISESDDDVHTEDVKEDFKAKIAVNKTDTAKSTNAKPINMKSKETVTTTKVQQKQVVKKPVPTTPVKTQKVVARTEKVSPKIESVTKTAVAPKVPAKAEVVKPKSVQEQPKVVTKKAVTKPVIDEKTEAKSVNTNQEKQQNIVVKANKNEPIKAVPKNTNTGTAKTEPPKQQRVLENNKAAPKTVVTIKPVNNLQTKNKELVSLSTNIKTTNASNARVVTETTNKTVNNKVSTSQNENKINIKPTLKNVYAQKVTEPTVKPKDDEVKKTDDAEIDFNDFALLMDGGIVLDECSGSDDE